MGPGLFKSCPTSNLSHESYPANFFHCLNQWLSTRNLQNKSRQLSLVWPEKEKPIKKWYLKDYWKDHTYIHIYIYIYIYIYILYTIHYAHFNDGVLSEKQHLGSKFLFFSVQFLFSVCLKKLLVLIYIVNFREVCFSQCTSWKSSSSSRVECWSLYIVSCSSHFWSTKCSHLLLACVKHICHLCIIRTYINFIEEEW